MKRRCTKEGAASVERGYSDESRAPQQKKSRVQAPDLVNASWSDYVVIGDMRYVLPYRFEFSMSFKSRWQGRTLLDVFTTEFSQSSTPAYWEEEVRAGRVLCNGVAVSSDRVWIEGDTVAHVVHRHESPVLSREIVIVHESDGYLAVDKPPSIPCHPCGTYRKNSLIYLLAAAGWTDLRVVHRLDKQTSGVVIFARTRKHASNFTSKLEAKNLRKRYVARVTGRFPQDINGAWLLVDEPLAFDAKSMLATVDVNGKPAQTRFQMLGYDAGADCSIVACEPLTGRTHQIRVHLRHLGHPIANDAVYSLAERLCEPICTLPLSAELHRPHSLRTDDPEIQAVDPNGGIMRTGADLNCSHCPCVVNAKGVAQDEEGSMIIYLHSWMYSGEGWKYTTPLPKWALLDGLEFAPDSDSDNDVRLPTQLSVAIPLTDSTRKATPDVQPHRAIDKTCTVM
jgi:tRNA pseudouridine32 synthase